MKSLLVLVLVLAAGLGAQEVLPSFGGTLRRIDSKKLLVETPDGNTLTFICSRKTKYFEGAKQVKSSAFGAGTQVSVEARQAPDGELEAVNVRVAGRAEKKLKTNAP